MIAYALYVHISQLAICSFSVALIYNVSLKAHSYFYMSNLLLVCINSYVSIASLHGGGDV